MRTRVLCTRRTISWNLSSAEIALWLADLDELDVGELPKRELVDETNDKGGIVDEADVAIDEPNRREVCAIDARRN